MTLPVFRTDLGRRFHRHWNTMRGNRLMPTLQEFLATPDPFIQPNIIVVDVAGADMLKVRLFATRLVSTANIDLTGSNLLAFAGSPQMARELWNVVHGAAAHPCGTCNLKLASTNHGRTVTVEVSSLPLAPFAGGPPCIASVVAVTAQMEYRDTLFELVRYVNRAWIDIGAGVPAPFPAADPGLWAGLRQRWRERKAAAA